jgi:excisionase family DNA binding protein
MTPEQPWLTTAEVATQLQVSQSTVRRWVYDHRLRGARVGKRWLIADPARSELTLEQAAALLRSHPDTVRRWLASGRLIGTRRGGRWSIRRDDLVAAIERGATRG